MDFWDFFWLLLIYIPLSILPALVQAFFFIIGLIAYPAAWAVYLSFTDKVIGQPEKFVGLQNYIWLTQWPNFGFSAEM